MREADGGMAVATSHAADTGTDIRMRSAATPADTFASVDRSCHEASMLMLFSKLNMQCVRIRIYNLQ